MQISILIISLVLVLSNVHKSAQDKYDGHYDLKARDAAYLCILMEDYLKTGKQPNLNKVSPDTIEKQKFTNGKPCWKFTWVPCDADTYMHTTQRPCGWYQMVKAPEKDC